MPKEVNIEETKVFMCNVCSKPIMYRLPRRLKGTFLHIGCSKYAGQRSDIPHSAFCIPHSTQEAQR